MIYSCLKDIQIYSFDYIYIENKEFFMFKFTMNNSSGLSLLCVSVFYILRQANTILYIHYCLTKYTLLFYHLVKISRRINKF